ncbi:MAG: VCBS repeat-containing protein [Candidatus Bipolaricaulota bacterium]|nr:VCBS repeat-containing protein [Candidatus Bipolaricaulota bacterium]
MALLGVCAVSDSVVSVQPTQRISTGSGTTALALGDLNHDGFLDIVTSLIVVPHEERGINTLNLAAVRGSVGGRFSPPTLIEFHSIKLEETVKTTRGKVLALGDLNGDGLLDAVLAYPTGGNFWTFWGDSERMLRPSPSRDLPRGLRDVSAVAVADFTNDGRLDLVCTNLQGNVYVFINNGTEQVDRWPLREIFVGGSLQSIAINDLNRDGKLDVIVSSIGRAATLLGDGTGNFALAQRLSVGLYSGDSPAWIEIADINGDDLSDLVTANPESDRLLVFPGDGRGQLDEPRAWATGALDPRAVIAADFNRDGWLDLAAANASSNLVTVHLNDGLGGFGSIPLLEPPRDKPVQSNRAIAVPVGSLPVSLAAGDLDNDGDPDLVVANQGDGSVSVLMNERR